MPPPFCLSKYHVVRLRLFLSDLASVLKFEENRVQSPLVHFSPKYSRALFACMFISSTTPEQHFKIINFK